MVVGDIATTVDVIVLGAGPGGYVSAIRAAQLGKDVVLVDPTPPGGACLHQGCIPAKALLSAADNFHKISTLPQMGISVENPLLDFNQMQQWRNKQEKQLTDNIIHLLDHNKVAFEQGRGWFLSENEVRVEAEYGTKRYIFEHAIIATGAAPAPFPNFDSGEEVRVLSPGHALRLLNLPLNLAIIGNNYIAAELATLFIKLGSSVRLLIPKEQKLLDEFDPAAGRYVQSQLQKLGVKIQTGVTDFAAACAKADTIIVSMGQIPCTDELRLEQVGLAPNECGFIPVNDQMQSGNPAIFAVGDVTGEPMLAHVAIKQGKVAAESLAGLPAQYAPQSIPRVAWTDPQVAAVGLTATQAQAVGYRVATGRFPLAACRRALTLDATAGFVQTVAEKETEVLLGVTIVGSHAETLIGEAALALEMGATLTDLAETLHPHPGFGEALQESAEAVMGIAVHIK